MFQTTAFTMHTIVNAQRLIVAPLTQSAFTFISWSDRDASSHTITVGPTNRTLVAEYRAFVRMPVIMRDD